VRATSSGGAIIPGTEAWVVNTLHRLRGLRPSLLAACMGGKQGGKQLGQCSGWVDMAGARVETSADTVTDVGGHGVCKMREATALLGFAAVRDVARRRQQTVGWCWDSRAHHALISGWDAHQPNHECSLQHAHDDAPMATGNAGGHQAA
jgi:hypothetical protein